MRTSIPTCNSHNIIIIHVPVLIKTHTHPSRLPSYACKFLEMCLMVTADHGPAVSGAHNTIIASRAGKDLVSSLASGLLTIGDRFGGALDGAAREFSQAYDSNMIPMEFVNSMRKQHKLIPGIGHRVKSVSAFFSTISKVINILLFHSSIIQTCVL